MMTPSSLSATFLLPSSTIESLQSLPECQSVFNILHGTILSSDGNSTTNTTTTSNPASQLQQALDNLHRSRDILRSLPELEVATYLLEVELLVVYGKFDLAMDSLARYEYLCNTKMKKNLSRKTKTRSNADFDDNNCSKRKLQFLKAKLFYISGQFSRALAEYEDVLECMEQEVDEQVQRMQLRQEENDGALEGNDDITNPLPVIDGAAVLSAVGITKLLIHLRKGRDYHLEQEHSNNTADIQDIIEAMETSADMLLDSRKDALLSHEHAHLAIDLGLAASIAITNLGVAHCLLRDDTSKAMELWKKGLTILDEILHDAMNSLTVIPKHKFICMESVRARLYCNIAWVLLGNLPWERGQGSFSIGPKCEDSTLKDASEVAKKALNIYDELMNGPKVTRDGGINDDDSDDNLSGDDAIRNEALDEDERKELENMLKDDETRQHQVEANDDEDDDPIVVTKPTDLPLSPQWYYHHQTESAWALGLVAQCYVLAGAAVTAEGIFRSAMDASSSHPLGQSLKTKDIMSGRELASKGVSLSSPNHGLIARDVRVWYANLCDMETKRKPDGDKLRSDAWKIEDGGVLRGYVRDKEGQGAKQSVSGLESSLWLFDPSDFER